ncbi:hypothetical protein Spb1_12430 [Planctopirus ephydatiae]|uniref:Uncharacterized protein n=1 Tax=Planctopirus ephydatiae TaxID=2528019 RepID=A0A518GLB0_9PLAN|nr:hypothetical protein Spb1_12430 [Planctopirus ephydatiae]
MREGIQGALVHVLKFEGLEHAFPARVTSKQNLRTNFKTSV